VMGQERVGDKNSLFCSKMWVPMYKWQLVEWLGEKYPEDKKKFKKMGKEQLLAIYYRVRGIG